MSRTRTKINKVDTSFYQRVTSVTVSGTSDTQTSTDVCVDDKGRATDHDLTIHHYRGTSFTPVNGVRFIPLTPGYFREYKNSGHAYAKSVSALHNVISIPTVGESATAAKAKSNPGRSNVNLTNFTHELKDLPSMIRDIGRFKLNGKKAVRTSKDLANYNLSVLMGWIPLVSDIKKLLNLSAYTDRRMLELQRLYSDKGLKRRIQLGTWSSTVEGDGTMASGNGDAITVKWSRSTTITRWATLRWRPTGLPKYKDGGKTSRKFARALVLGQGGQFGPISTEAAWNALPWSWLIDWGGNIGDWISANNNAVPSVATSVCIMTKYETKTSFQRTDGWLGYTGGTGSTSYVTKKRDVVGGSLSAHLPGFSGRQLSVLASLAVQRGKR